MQLKWPMLWDLFSLFPAYAGVILAQVLNVSEAWPFPRIRGGDPESGLYSLILSSFSPHTRG